MKALSQYQELFDYVALLLRWLRQGGAPDPDKVRNEVKKQLARIQRSVQGDPLQKSVFQHVRLPLIFFVDHVIVESQSKLAEFWRENRLAFEENELAGDEKFFDIVEELLGNPAADATEALAVLYTCMGLGFAGWYTNQPEQVRELMETIAQRLPVGLEPQSLIAPAAYLSLDTRNLIETGRTKIGWMVMAFLCAMVVSVIASFLVFHLATQKMTQSLDEIIMKERFLYPDAEEVQP